MLRLALAAYAWPPWQADSTHVLVTRGTSTVDGGSALRLFSPVGGTIVSYLPTMYSKADLSYLYTPPLSSVGSARTTSRGDPTIKEIDWRKSKYMMPSRLQLAALLWVLVLSPALEGSSVLRRHILLLQVIS